MGAVDIITILIPIYYIVIAILILGAAYFFVKIAKRYLANGKLQEERIKIETNEITEIKRRLDNIESLIKNAE
ncbi:hypothetical protein [Jeotgalibacillus campisalis]|uniref:DUF4083 domain-containing protein n=1 Tax=Jeotgalibacillus campisalis TaxID=220754 RepID=A0A0C2VVE8_9BACL|nr:hypothetical protein [Jeotgalibacillus campisalis]KIL47948.1 hypothetical protein KR50_21150 [Jeotgalibacillus campisalis]